MALFASAFLAMLAPAIVTAQQVAGVVVDANGRAVRDADVIVGTDLRARTDSAGAFELSVRDRGPTRLRVRFIGFRPFETSIDPSRPNSQSLRITLVRTPQLLAEVRITDINGCELNTIKGFECRRNTGQGIFRDAAEIRSLQPSAWSDMFDGIPTLRRVPMDTPDGLDWRPAAMPSTCVNRIFNGENPRFDGHIRKVPYGWLVTRDVIAIEYYDEYAKVPEAFKRYAWARQWSDLAEAATAEPTPMPSGQPCGLIVYWIREGQARARSARTNTVPRPPITRRP